MLSENQLLNKCLIYSGGHQCRYLETHGSKSGDCIKLLVKKRDLADKRAAEIIKDSKKNGVDPYSLYVAIGTGGNCKGYPYLKTVLQGYDVKKS